MHELIDYLTEYELSLAEEICTHLKPDALFHHDDWESQTPTSSHRKCLRNSTFRPIRRFTGCTNPWVWKS